MSCSKIEFKLRTSFEKGRLISGINNNQDDFTIAQQCYSSAFLKSFFFLRFDYLLLLLGIFFV